MKQKFVTFPKFARRVFSIHLNETEANPRSLRKEEDVIGEKREWGRERGTMRRGWGGWEKKMRRTGERCIECQSSFIIRPETGFKVGYGWRKNWVGKVRDFIFSPLIYRGANCAGPITISFPGSYLHLSGNSI